MITIYDNAFSYDYSCYVWNFVNGSTLTNNWKSLKEIPATSKESDALSKDLKKRGMKFVGSTIIYAYMQAVGLINEHLVSSMLKIKNSLSTENT